MKLRLIYLGIMLCLTQIVAVPLTLQAEKAAAFSFANAPYFHRYSKDDLYEYTPDGQTDLKAWADMVTINLYHQAKDGDGLAAVANGVLGTYQANQAAVVKTASVPRRPDRPAEHFIAVIFRHATFSEAVFARFKMHEGIGSAVIYSHRTYGKNAGEAMRSWVTQNGPAMEKNLLAWDAMPKLAALK
jgi:hypothetical protein